MEITAVARGRVQGVNFRSYVKSLADSMRLKGYAKNLADGDVEIVINGNGEMVAEFLEMVKNKRDEWGIRVDSLSWKEKKEEKYKGFSTRGTKVA
jgi:acylphosphatase